MPESQNIEWKERWRDEFLKWICGFEKEAFIPPSQSNPCKRILQRWID